MSPVHTITTTLLAVCGLAHSDILIDQIGGSDGGSLSGDVYGSMRLAPAPAFPLDLGAIDDIHLESAADLEAIEFVLDGWYNFAGPDDVLAWEVNIYTDLAAAASNLAGDLLHQTASPVVVDSWEGPGWLIRLPVNISLSAGTYFLSAIMTNPYPSNGWVGVATSDLGNDSAWQVSPDGDYVFSPLIETTDNLAYRVLGTPVPAPASGVLLTIPLLWAHRARGRCRLAKTRRT